MKLHLTNPNCTAVAGDDVVVTNHPFEAKTDWGLKGKLEGFTHTHGYARVMVGPNVLLFHPEAIRIDDKNKTEDQQ